MMFVVIGFDGAGNELPCYKQIKDKHDKRLKKTIRRELV